MSVNLLPVSPDHLAVPTYMNVVGLVRPTMGTPTSLMSFLNGSHNIFPAELPPRVDSDENHRIFFSPGFQRDRRWITYYMYNVVL